MSARPSPPLRRSLAALLVVAVAALGALGLVDLGGPAPAAPADTVAPDTVAPEIAAPETARSLVVRGPAGATDLGPTLARIERGEAHPHRNDGEVFRNHERQLPERPRGYYREYVHPTPGQRGPGAQRIVIGASGDVWYTPDHYETFQRVRWTFHRGVPR